jgi:hypothetical protein
MAVHVLDNYGKNRLFAPSTGANRPTYACSGWIPPVPTAKRSVTRAKTRPIICHKRWELDIKTRLEKQRFAA